MNKDTSLYNAVKDITSGTFGGIAQVCVGHPLDTIKVRLQTQQPDPVTGEMPFKSMVDCAKKTFAGEGIGGLYKGAASPLLGAVHNAGVFFSYGQAKRLTGADVKEAEIYRFGLAGAIAAVPITAVETPVDLFKIKLQTQVGSGGEYKGVFDAGRKIIGRYGWQGAFQGFSATMARNIPCFGTYFCFSEFGYRLVNPPDALIAPTVSRAFLGGLVGGALAGFGFWGIFYPLEVVKTRMQSDDADIAKRRYKSLADCTRQTYSEGGIQAFYKGYTPAIVRAIPVNAAIFCVVFSVKNAMS